MAAISDEEENYVCTLDEASKERARKELNEDEKNRDGAVQTLRDWVKQQQWLKSPTGAVDMKRICEMGLVNFMRTFTLVHDIILMDERAQVNGVVLIADLGDVTIQHNIKLFTPENTKILMSTLEGALPMRVKSMNPFNVGPLMEAFVALVMAILKQKLRDRIHVHGKSLVSLYKEIDMSVLPTEYLSDNYTGHSSGSLQSIIDNFKAEIIKPEVVDHIRTLTTSGYGVDTKLKPLVVPNESFRKLNVD